MSDMPPLEQMVVRASSDTDEDSVVHHKRYSSGGSDHDKSSITSQDEKENVIVPSMPADPRSSSNERMNISSQRSSYSNPFYVGPVYSSEGEGASTAEVVQGGDCSNGSRRASAPTEGFGTDRASTADKLPSQGDGMRKKGHARRYSHDELSSTHRHLPGSIPEVAAIASEDELRSTVGRTPVDRKEKHARRPPPMPPTTASDTRSEPGSPLRKPSLSPVFDDYGSMSPSIGARPHREIGDERLAFKSHSRDSISPQPRTNLFSEVEVTMTDVDSNEEVQTDNHSDFDSFEYRVDSRAEARRQSLGSELERMKGKARGTDARRRHSEQLGTTSAQGSNGKAPLFGMPAHSVPVSAMDMARIDTTPAGVHVEEQTDMSNVHYLGSKEQPGEQAVMQLDAAFGTPQAATIPEEETITPPMYSKESTNTIPIPSRSRLGSLRHFIPRGARIAQILLSIINFGIYLSLVLGDENITVNRFGLAASSVAMLCTTSIFVAGLIGGQGPSVQSKDAYMEKHVTLAVIDMTLAMLVFAAASASAGVVTSDTSGLSSPQSRAGTAMLFLLWIAMVPSVVVSVGKAAASRRIAAMLTSLPVSPYGQDNNDESVEGDVDASPDSQVGVNTWPASKVADFMLAHGQDSQVAEKIIQENINGKAALAMDKADLNVLLADSDLSDVILVWSTLEKLREVENARLRGPVIPTNLQVMQTVLGRVVSPPMWAVLLLRSLQILFSATAIILVATASFTLEDDDGTRDVYGIDFHSFEFMVVAASMGAAFSFGSVLSRRYLTLPIDLQWIGPIISATLEFIVFILLLCAGSASAGVSADSENLGSGDLCQFSTREFCGLIQASTAFTFLTAALLIPTWLETACKPADGFQ
mmetsp:Transcript_13356/g.48620  ORF Transcript_13356/g.48620 Transcript_13356/m.48620 type:complete len:872 (+) Transcript_13356:91-2706(+)